MTQKVLIEAQLSSGISISRSRSSRMPEINDYIPGSTLRGALATSYLRHFGKDDMFGHFIDGNNHFPDLLPSSDGTTGVIPDTAFACKRDGGFGRDKHGVYDHLFVEGARKLLEEFAPSRVPNENELELFFTCPVCAQAAKRYSGYVSGTGARKVFRIHVGIDRLTGTASPNILYGVTALQPDDPKLSDKAKFSGLAALDSKFFDRLEELQRREPTIFVGRAKSRGYGEISWNLQKTDDPVDKKLLFGVDVRYRNSLNSGKLQDDLVGLLARSGYALPADAAVHVVETDRLWQIVGGEESWYLIAAMDNQLKFYGSLRAQLESFDANFRKFCQTPPFIRQCSDEKFTRENEFYFAVGMEATTIIVDRWLRYTARADQVLEALDLPDTRCIYEISSLVSVLGWNKKHGLPKEDEFGVKRGSVYLLASTAGQAVIDRLQELGRYGIGLRREEGFGHLTISNPFHWQY